MSEGIWGYFAEPMLRSEETKDMSYKNQFMQRPTIVIGLTEFLGIGPVYLGYFFGVHSLSSMLDSESCGGGLEAEGPTLAPAGRMISATFHASTTPSAAGRLYYGTLANYLWIEIRGRTIRVATLREVAGD